MSELSWADLRERAIRLFNGELPNAQTESEIIDGFERSPLATASTLEQVAADFAAGKVRSGWAVWRSNLARAASPARNPTVETGLDREQRIGNAERWLRNAGVHFDRWEDVEDELFTVPTGRERGHLHEWADDTLLRERMLKLWQKLRPRGEQAEADELRRAEEWKANRQRVLEAMRARRDRLDAAQTMTRKGEAA